MKTTNYYASIDRNEPTNFEAMVLDSVDAIKDRQVAYCFTAEQCEAIQNCFEDTLTVEDLGDGFYAVYNELTGHARNELKEARG